MLLFLLVFQLVFGHFYATKQIFDSVRVEYEYEVNSVFGLNSKYADFSPVWHYTDLVFASDREWDYNNYGESNWNKSKKMMRGMKGNRKFRRQMQSMMDLDDNIGM